MNFVANLPAHRWYVNLAALTHDPKDSLSLTEAWPVSVKSVPGQTFMYQAYIPEYAAMYDKLPISAFRWRSRKEEHFLPLEQLVWWDCFSYDIQVMTLDFVSSMRVKCRIRDREPMYGHYLFTVDHADPDARGTLAEHWPEHKAAHHIALENGQIGIFPNNCLQWFDDSLTPKEIPAVPFRVWPEPDFPRVENVSLGRERLGDTETFNYE